MYIGKPTGVTYYILHGDMLSVGKPDILGKKGSQTLFCRVEYFSQQTHSCQLAHPGDDHGIGGGTADFGVGNTNCTGS